MQNQTLGQLFAKELEIEARASRACLERIPENLFSYKPHEKSMLMSNLALVVADIPRWITYAIKDSVIDFATYPQVHPKNGEELAKHFDEVVAEAKKALEGVSDEALQEMFYLKNNGQELMKSTKEETISSSINHLVHHRGQLTVYMRLNNIPVPSIYGPSADDGSF